MLYAMKAVRTKRPAHINKRLPCLDILRLRVVSQSFAALLRIEIQSGAFKLPPLFFLFSD